MGSIGGAVAVGEDGAECGIWSGSEGFGGVVLYTDGAVDARAFKAVDGERSGTLGEDKFTCIALYWKGGERQTVGRKMNSGGLAREVMKGEAAHRVGMHALALAEQLDFWQGLA